MVTAVHPSNALTEFEARGGRGRRFEPTTERQLDSDLRALARTLPGAHNGLLGVVEFPSPRGVPDLLVATRAYEALGRRLSSGLPFVESPSDCAVIAALKVKRTRSIESVSSETGISVAQVERRLRALSNLGVAIAHGLGYRRSPEIEPIGRIYAFEAKVSDWRRGLSQALRYSEWSDASSLVLLRPPSNLDDVADRCATLDIGLAVRDEWIRKPKIGRPHSALRLEASERLALEVSNLKSEPLASCVGLQNI